MSEPTVCAILLTADRPEYARRAVECFRAQTYQNKRLVVFQEFSRATFEPEIFAGLHVDYFRGDQKATIGELRNAANAVGYTGHVNIKPDILIHWDDDDWSHPNRIAEQVALLQSSGADVVGYREILFWREPFGSCICRGDGLMGMRCDAHGEAWLYSNPDPRYCLGTSLCYWRKTWERKPFEATSQGEDVRFCTGLDCVGVSTIIAPNGIAFTDPMQPRMIARIHSGNTSTVYRPELMAAIERQGGEWKRSPEWDSYCRGVCE